MEPPARPDEIARGRGLARIRPDPVRTSKMQEMNAVMPDAGSLCDSVGS